MARFTYPSWEYIRDDSHVLQPKQLTLDDTLQYEETPIQILDRKMVDTCRGSVALVKVLWSNHVTEEATWEAEDAMKRDYPWLFTQVFLCLPFITIVSP